MKSRPRGALVLGWIYIRISEGALRAPLPKSPTRAVRETNPVPWCLGSHSWRKGDECDRSNRQRWIPGPGFEVIKPLEWEQAAEKIYDPSSAPATNGDIVIDCAGYIGRFTRTALLAGARRVEPPTPKSRISSLSDAIFRKR
jgi:hypothetical protein